MYQGSGRLRRPKFPDLHADTYISQRHDPWLVQVVFEFAPFWFLILHTVLVYQFGTGICLSQKDPLYSFSPIAWRETEIPHFRLSPLSGSSSWPAHTWVESGRDQRLGFGAVGFALALCPCIQAGSSYPVSPIAHTLQREIWACSKLYVVLGTRHGAMTFRNCSALDEYPTLFRIRAVNNFNRLNRTVGMPVSLEMPTNDQPSHSNG